MAELQEHFPGFHLGEKVFLDGRRDDTIKSNTCIEGDTRMMQQIKTQEERNNRNSTAGSLEYASHGVSYKGEMLIVEIEGMDRDYVLGFPFVYMIFHNITTGS